MSGEISRLFVTVGSDISGLVKGLNDASSRLQSFGAGFARQGALITAGLTAPIVAAGREILQSGSSFESAFAGVEKTVDMTAGELATLRQEIRDMAKDIPATREEIAGVAEAAGQLGIQNSAIEEFTRTMIDMGNSTNLASDEAADKLARLANIFQMPQDQFDNLGSTVVHLGNRLAATESEIVGMGQRIAGAGHQIGMTEAQVLGFAGAISSVGINIEAGGSAISSFFVRMAKAVQAGGDELAGFAKAAGMSVRDFTKLFKRDAAGATTAFVEGLSDIQKSGGNVLGILNDLGISGIRERDVIMRLVGAGDLLHTSLDEAAKGWAENNALTKEAAKRYETMESRWKITKNRLSDVAVTLYDHLRPALMSVMDGTGRLISGLDVAIKLFTRLPSNVKGAALGFLAVLAATGPLIVAFGGLTTALGFLLSPIGLLMTATATLAAAFTGNFGGMRDTVMSAVGPILSDLGFLWNGIVNGFESGGIKGAIDGFIGHLYAISPRTAETIDPILATLGTLWDGIVTGFKQDGITGAIDGLITKIGEISPACTPLATEVRPVLQGMREGWGLARDSLITFKDALAGDWKNAETIDPLHQAIGNLGLKGHEVFEWFTNYGIPNMAAAFAESMPRNVELIKGLASAITSELDESGKHTDANAADFEAWNQRTGASLNNVMATVQRWGAVVHDSVVVRAKANLQEFFTYWDPTWDEVAHVVREAGFELASNWNNAVTGVGRDWDNLKSAFYNGFQTLNTSLVNAVKDVQKWAGDVVTEITALPGKITGAIGNLSTLLFSAGADVIAGLIAGITSKIPSVTSVLETITGLIPKHKGPPAKDAKLLFESGRSIIQSLLDGFGSMEPKLVEKLKSITDMIGSVFSTISGGVDAMSKLAGYKPGLLRDTVVLFSNDLFGTVSTLEAVVQRFSKDGIKAAGEWADGAGKLVSIIGSGVDALMKLPSYKGVTRAAVLLFGYDLYGVVSTLQVITRDFDRDGVRAAAEWAESAGKIVGIIGAGVDGLLKLIDLKPIPAGAIDLLGEGIRLAVRKMADLAHQFDVDGTAAAAVFAEAVSKIVAPIGAAVDAFTKLREYQGVLPWMFDMLGADMRLAVIKMIDLASHANSEGVAAAALFSEAVSKVFGALKAGVETLDAIREYKGLPPGAVQAFLNDFMGVLSTMAILLTNGDVAVAQAETWKGQMEAFRDAIKAGVEALNSVGSIPPVPSVPGAQAPAAPDVSATRLSIAGMRAAGGPVAANKPYIVGEQGPELFMSGRSGSIVPNHELGRGSSGQPLQQNFYIEAGTSDEDVRRIMRIAREEAEGVVEQYDQRVSKRVLGRSRRQGFAV